MVHGCTLFLPLQTRTHDLWTNNEQPKRRNEMSDKMMTPDEYLIENPTHMLVENELDGHTYAEYVKDKKRVCSDALQINWTGYTEPHVMIGPEFPQSRKRVVEWGKSVCNAHKILDQLKALSAVNLPIAKDRQIHRRAFSGIK
jgi:hypothetical protein